jgi:clan AA aspartic protease
MGLVRAKIILRNPRDSQLKPLDTEALVDTGSLHLCVPEHVALQLRLEELEKREVTTADATKRLCSYVGPLEVHFENRACYTGALVLGDEVLLGVVPMEDMDLVISPSLRTVTVNPQSPNIPSSVVKRARRVRRVVYTHREIARAEDRS